MLEEDTLNSKKSYGQILKTTAVFGSVKFFSVLIGLFKAKIIAIFLGPAGMGVFNLINYPISLISQFSGLGISTSGIREVAQSDNEQKLRETAEVIKCWNRTTGVIGSLLLFLLAPWISKISFGDESYTWAFRILSVVVFITALGSEYEVMLRGRRETKLVAKAGFYSSLAGFIVSIPFYYAFGTAGIVVVILITAITLAGVNYFYAKKLNIQPMKLPYKEIFLKGKDMASIGFFIVLGDLIFVGVITIVNSFLREKGGVEEVGYFQACMQLTQSSINVILLAMAADFYPRLSTVQKSKKDTNRILCQQLEIAVLLCLPILIVMILGAPAIIIILLSESFMPIQHSICLFLCATIFRIPSWGLTFVLLANGKTKNYALFVFSYNFVMLPLYCLGYIYMKVEGMGVSYILLTILYSSVLSLYMQKKYDVFISKSFLKLYFVSIILIVLALVISFFSISWTRIVVSGFIILISVSYSIWQIKIRTNIFPKIHLLKQ